MPIAFVTDPADPRLDDYRELKEARLDQRSGRFVAESELVVRKLLISGLRVLSVLVTAPRLRALEEVLGQATSVLVVPQELMDGVVGFHVHRGCLAVAERPRDVAIPENARTLLVLEDLVDVDNVGALVRNAAAFGADAVMLSPRCADAYYRKAIRVSMGAVFAVPIVRATSWPQELVALRSRGFTLAGAVLDDDAIALPLYERPEKIAVLLGAEGPGLSPATRSVCDALVTVPMSHADSLNVATAGAIFLYQLCRS